jgi:hypothetical protein
MKKIVSTTVKEVLDPQTGEVLQYEASKTYKEKITSESFYMIFLDYMAPLFKIKSPITRNVLDRMCQMAEFNSGNVTMAPADRKTICDDLVINAQQFSKALKQLKELNLITGESGKFTINPYVFWKGDQAIRRKELLDNKAFQITCEIVDDTEE